MLNFRDISFVRDFLFILCVYVCVCVCARACVRVCVYQVLSRLNQI